MDNKIGELIAKYRRENNMTQKELADKLGVSNTAVSKWECGNNLPDITMLKPLSQLLKVDILTLIGLEEEVLTDYKDDIKKKAKKKIFIMVNSILFILFVLLSIHLMVVKKYENKIKEASSNGIEVYRLSSKGELFLDGYLIVKENKMLLDINSIKYQDKNIGTKSELMASSLIINLFIDGNGLYTFECESDDNKIVNINNLLDNISNYKKDNLIISYDNNLKIDNIILELNYYKNGKFLDSFSFPLDINQIFVD